MADLLDPDVLRVQIVRLEDDLKEDVVVCDYVGDVLGLTLDS